MDGRSNSSTSEIQTRLNMYLVGQLQRLSPTDYSFYDLAKERNALAIQSIMQDVFFELGREDFEKAETRQKCC